MKQRFVLIAVISFVAVIVEIILIYLSRTRGDLGFKVKITPDMDWF